MTVFKALHVKGDPLVLVNIWDAGSARAVADTGATALATGSASVAGALGYPDGEAVPFETLMDVIARIRAAVLDLPLSVDFEAGFAPDPAGVAHNGARLAALGVAGVNLEDGLPPETGIRPAPEAAARIAALRAATALFINARTDLFLLNPPEGHADLIPEALARARAYADAGADGFFAPGLTDPAMIADLCAGTDLPVNVMASPTAPPRAVLAQAGVARISHGPFPWRAAMAGLGDAARQALQG